MDAKKPRRWRKWLWILLAIFVGVPVVVITLAQIMFAAHSIPKELLTPPPKALTIKPEPARAPLAINWQSWREPANYNNVRKQYLEFFKSRDPKAVNLALLEKWQTWMSDGLMQTRINGPFGAWEAGHPLNDAQAKWLREHQEFINDMIKMANAGGFPKLTCEEAAAFSDKNLAERMNPYFTVFHSLALTLAAEARRRQDAGDLAGAAEIILAMSRFGRSIDEPALMDLAISYNSFGAASSVSLEKLAQSGLPPELAKMLRDEFDSIPREDYRRQLEIEYRGLRHNYVQILNGPFLGVFIRQMSMETLFTRDAESYNQYLRGHTIDCLAASFVPAVHAAQIKGSADNIIEHIDENFMTSMEHYKPENFWNPDKNYFQFKLPNPYIHDEFFAVFPETAKTVRARRNLALAGLDIVLGGNTNSTTRIDPFTGTPLKVIEKPDEILIYSVAPDRRDDHAKVEFAPSAVGDYIIRIPRKKTTP